MEKMLLSSVQVPITAASDVGTDTSSRASRLGLQGAQRESQEKERSLQVRIMLVEAGKWIQQGAIRNIELGWMCWEKLVGKGHQQSRGKRIADSLTMGWTLLRRCV